jgi:hypothetical protein
VCGERTRVWAERTGTIGHCQDAVCVGRGHRVVAAIKLLRPGDRRWTPRPDDENAIKQAPLTLVTKPPAARRHGGDARGQLVCAYGGPDPISGSCRVATIASCAAASTIVEAAGGRVSALGDTPRPAASCATVLHRGRRKPRSRRLISDSERPARWASSAGRKDAALRCATKRHGSNVRQRSRTYFATVGRSLARQRHLPRQHSTRSG